MIYELPCSFIRFYLWDVSCFSVFLLFGVLNFALPLTLCTADFLLFSYSALLDCHRLNHHLRLSPPQRKQNRKRGQNIPRPIIWSTSSVYGRLFLLCNGCVTLTLLLPEPDSLINVIAYVTFPVAALALKSPPASRLQSQSVPFKTPHGMAVMEG